MFSKLQTQVFIMFLIASFSSGLFAENLTEKDEKEIYSQILVAALLGATDDLRLYKNVNQDPSGKKLKKNVLIMAEHIKDKSENCQKEIKVMKRMHEADQMGADDRIPVASIQDFDCAGSISERLDDMLNRTRDMESFIQMRDALTSHFGVYFSSRSERDMCSKVFPKGYSDNKTSNTSNSSINFSSLSPSEGVDYNDGVKNPELKELCDAFYLLRSNLIEMRTIDRISEYMRQDVSERYYDGRLEPRESRFPPKHER